MNVLDINSVNLIVSPARKSPAFNYLKSCLEKMKSYVIKYSMPLPEII